MSVPLELRTGAHFPKLSSLKKIRSFPDSKFLHQTKTGMRITPAFITKTISVLCLLLAGGPGAVSARQPSKPAQPLHRARKVVESKVDPAKDDVTTYDDPVVRAVAVQ